MALLDDQAQGRVYTSSVMPADWQQTAVQQETTAGITGYPTPTPENNSSLLTVDQINAIKQTMGAASNSTATTGGVNEATGNEDGGFQYGPIGEEPYNPSDYVDDPFDMNTTVDGAGPVPEDMLDPVEADDPTRATGAPAEGQHTVVNPDGSVSVAGEAVTREVQDEEKTSYQLNQLLSSDSKYMQDARRQGLEQSAAMGGLGGSVGAGASMQAAIRAGLPIAQEDARAFQQAASENMTALNQYAQLNLQRATQLELGNLDSRTQLSNSKMQAQSQQSIAKLQSATERDISKLNNETQLRATEMQGQIQSRMAAFQYQYNSLLEDQKSANDIIKIQQQGELDLLKGDQAIKGEMAITDIKGQWEYAIQEQQRAAQREQTYMGMMVGAYDGMMTRLEALNGMDMDDAAMQGAINSIMEGTNAIFGIIQGLYPDLPQIFDTGGGSGGAGGTT